MTNYHFMNIDLPNLTSRRQDRASPIFGVSLNLILKIKCVFLWLHKRKTYKQIFDWLSFVLMSHMVMSYTCFWPRKISLQFLCLKSTWPSSCRKSLLWWLCCSIEPRFEPSTYPKTLYVMPQLYFINIALLFSSQHSLWAWFKHKGKTLSFISGI